MSFHAALIRPLQGFGKFAQETSQYLFTRRFPVLNMSTRAGRDFFLSMPFVSIHTRCLNVARSRSYSEGLQRNAGLDMTNEYTNRPMSLAKPSRSTTVSWHDLEASQKMWRQHHRHATSGPSWAKTVGVNFQLDQAMAPPRHRDLCPKPNPIYKRQLRQRYPNRLPTSSVRHPVSSDE